MSSSELLFLILFLVLITGILIFDLMFVGRKSHVVSFKEALTWSIVWISLAGAFYFVIRYFGERIHGIENFEDLEHIVSRYAPEIKLDTTDFAASVDLYRKTMALNYITGYLIEETLSIDNLFVIFMILTAFSVLRFIFYFRWLCPHLQV